MKDFTKKYYELLVGEFSGINLTRITDFKEFSLKQIDDSLEPVKQSKMFSNSLKKNGVMVDIGFGGGFPILPMAKYLPQYKYIGIETRNKKVQVVGQIAERLGLVNVKLQHSRIENVLIDKEVTMTLKAVGKVNDFLSKLSCTKTCQVFFFKGPNFYELEREQIETAVNSGWKIITEEEVILKGVEKRYLIGFENVKVLHGTKIISNNLVKLSHLL